ncbi:MAG: hypothetical protein VXX28_10095, partial [Verrucomicrobiota bacterium]|nr:hypothetical protein [Verrucomicrobiota bacterium]
MMLLPVRLTSHAILALGSLGALFGQETDLKDEDPAIPNIRLTEKNWGQGSPQDVVAILESTARQLFPYTGKKEWADVL